MSETTTDPETEQSATRIFDADDVAEFASLSGDLNPLHTDPEYAAETRFGEPIVHGALVMSLVSAALAKFDGTVIYVNQDASFLRPVYPGEKVTATARVHATDDQYHTMVTTVENERGETVVEGMANVVIDAGPAAVADE